MNEQNPNCKITAIDHESIVQNSSKSLMMQKQKTVSSKKSEKILEIQN